MEALHPPMVFVESVRIENVCAESDTRNVTDATATTQDY
ncbi:hypothetical protein RHOER0001_0031 [Rhodococcus erythropolis SK121]|nr:hypothetical protein RHOER0001_0031 [Rhodococcus erythropolis SK121]